MDFNKLPFIIVIFNEIFRFNKIDFIFVGTEQYGWMNEKKTKFWPWFIKIQNNSKTVEQNKKKWYNTIKLMIVVFIQLWFNGSLPWLLLWWWWLKIGFINIDNFVYLWLLTCYSDVWGSTNINWLSSSS